MIAGKCILVVEDEYLVAAMVADMIEQEGGVPVGPAASVAEAAALIALGGLDAAVVDWNLQGEPAEAVAQALDAAGVPFVIATGYSEVSGAFAGRPVLGKPFAGSLLVEELGKLLNT